MGSRGSRSSSLVYVFPPPPLSPVCELSGEGKEEKTWAPFLMVLHDGNLEEDKLGVDGYRAPVTSGASRKGSAEEKSLSDLHAEHCCLLLCGRKQLDRQLSTYWLTGCSQQLAGRSGTWEEYDWKVGCKNVGKKVCG